MKISVIRAGLVAGIALLAFAGCSGTDVVGRVAAKSFATVVEASKSSVFASDDGAYWNLGSPKGDLFRLSTDFARNNGGSTADLGRPDAALVLDAAPFLAAGLDPAKVEGWVFAKVELRDDAGKILFVDKLLRPYNLI